MATKKTPIKTADVRKAIPLGVKLKVLIRQSRCAACGKKLGAVEHIEYDHRPALVNREWDEAAKDFIPPQHDPEHIEAICDDCHQKRTTGRAGEIKSTVYGSDIHTRDKARRIEVDSDVWRNLLAPKKRKKKTKSRWPKRKFRN